MRNELKSDENSFRNKWILPLWGNISSLSPENEQDRPVILHPSLLWHRTRRVQHRSAMRSRGNLNESRTVIFQSRPWRVYHQTTGLDITNTKCCISSLRQEIQPDG